MSMHKATLAPRQLLRQSWRKASHSVESIMEKRYINKTGYPVLYNG